MEPTTDAHDCGCQRRFCTPRQLARKNIPGHAGLAAAIRDQQPAVVCQWKRQLLESAFESFQLFGTAEVCTRYARCSMVSARHGTARTAFAAIKDREVHIHSTALAISWLHILQELSHYDGTVFLLLTALHKGIHSIDYDVFSRKPYVRMYVGLEATMKRDYRGRSAAWAFSGTQRLRAERCQAEDFDAQLFAAGQPPEMLWCCRAATSASPALITSLLNQSDHFGPMLIRPTKVYAILVVPNMLTMRDRRLTLLIFISGALGVPASHLLALLAAPRFCAPLHKLVLSLRAR
uniref:Uncharacterized protein n=1 Tax=Ascaris lumbricoides TaxID=6252 RepID=A0A0M3HXR5_ASCLU